MRNCWAFIPFVAGFATAQWETAYTATAPAAVAKAAATALTLSPTSNVKGKAFDRFVVVWLENTDYDKAVGDPNLAYLAKKGITLSNYFALTHPSEPNYLSSIGGDYFGLDDDDFVRLPKNVSSIVDLLEEKGISWGEYQEDQPYSGFEGMAYVNQKTGANDYVRKHNPAISYDANASLEKRLAVVKNLTMFYKDLEADKLPQWMFITPNMTSDGHDTSVTTAGVWTRNFLDPLLTNKKFMKNTLVLVTFDENHTYTAQNNVLAILLGDAVPANLVGTTDSSYYNHYSEIATVEANWGLNTLGRHDVGANVFKVVADKTGDVVRKWTGTPALSDMYFNKSIAGPFNAEVQTSWNAYAPDVEACYAGRSVSPLVKRQWSSFARKETMYSTSLEVPDYYHPTVGEKKRAS